MLPNSRLTTNKQYAKNLQYRNKGDKYELFTLVIFTKANPYCPYCWWGGITFFNFSTPELLTDKYIFVETEGVLLQFDNSGKFIRKINTIGQGPTECPVSEFAISERDQLIYILHEWNGNIYVFDFTGKYIKTIPKPLTNKSEGEVSSAPNVCSIFYMDCDRRGNVLLVFNNDDRGQGQMKYKYAVMDNTGKILHKSPNYDKYVANGSIHEIKGVPHPIYEYKGDNYYKYIFNDTVFKINDDYTCSPAYIINLPDRLTLKQDMEGQINKNRLNKNMHFAVREGEKYLYIYHLRESDRNYKFFLSRYNKQTRQLTENININFKNDWDGGMDVQIHPFYQNERTVSVWLQPFNMKEKLTDSHFAEVQAKYSDKKNALKELINRAEEDDNPILMILKLK